ncbi:hypothetical protein Tco_1205139 [Tanacetum coccineum]
MVSSGPGNSGCKPSGILYSEVNSRRYSLDMVDTASSSCITKPLDEDDDVVVLENSETKEEDVKEDESDHNKERYTFEDDDDDVEFDDLD